MKEVKLNLKKIRVNKNITQVELSDMTGITQQNISAYETGKNIPLLDSAAKIADALGVSLDELVSIREAHEQVGKKLIKLSKKGK